MSTLSATPAVNPTSTAASEPTVLYEKRLGEDPSGPAVALLTLNRPTLLNSFSPAMHEAIWQALDQAEADPSVRAVVITGAGRGFCAGADLGGIRFTSKEEFMQKSDPGPVIERYFNTTARRLQSLKLPTLAAVNGVAAGAGMSLVMSCDVAIASPQASFIQAFSKIGLIPDAGSTWLLPRRVGLARAMVLAMTGDKLSAAKALEWGLLWDVQEDFLGATLAMAHRMAAMPTQALVATRQLLRDGTGVDLNTQLDAERDAQSRMGKTNDHYEGVVAFLQKRPAVFKGH